MGGGHASSIVANNDGRSRHRLILVVDIPFEFVSEVAGASAVAEASHVEGGTASRHDVCNIHRKTRVKEENTMVQQSMRNGTKVVQRRRALATCEWREKSTNSLDWVMSMMMMEACTFLMVGQFVGFGHSQWILCSVGGSCRVAGSRLIRSHGASRGLSQLRHVIIIHIHISLCC